METYSSFQLYRLSDGLTYRFDRQERLAGFFAYKRRDQDLWITYQGRLGWVAFDDDTKAIHGRPWDCPPEEQNSSHPPEGTWVSRKGPKSYVYELTYLPQSEALKRG